MMRFLSALLHTKPLRWAFFVAMALGSVAITASSLAYFDDENLHPFVVEKIETLTAAYEELWLGSLTVHVVAAAFALPACLLLLSRRMMRAAPRFHRWLGRLAGTVIVCALAPSGAVLAFHAKGGVLGTAGFMLSGAIVVVAMVRAVIDARARRFDAHRRAVWHVAAQLSVAVTSRAMLFALDAASVDEHTAYLASLWIPVLGSAALVEWLSARPRASFKMQPGEPMNRIAALASCVIPALLGAATLASPASATPPSTTASEAALAVVNKALLTPLKERDRERSRFSRAAEPPAERRVRVTDAAPVKDVRGGEFFTFAIDTRHGFVDDKWSEGTIVGCLYPAAGELFVKAGDGHRPSAHLLGKKTKPAAAHVCEPASTATTHEKS